MATDPEPETEAEEVEIEWVEPIRLPDVVTKTDLAVRMLLESVSRDVGISIHELSTRTIIIEGGVLRVEE